MRIRIGANHKVTFFVSGRAYQGIILSHYILFQEHHKFCDLILSELSILYGNYIRTHSLFSETGYWPEGNTAHQLAFIEELLRGGYCDVLTKEELERINKLNHV